ncbi:MAG: cytochrome b/b6 domain-containing protein [Acidobacteria bacterium]|nr:cytochrome b/b6 domain-containing protein [Acidobacteriota bacterium]
MQPNQNVKHALLIGSVAVLLALLAAPFAAAQGAAATEAEDQDPCLECHAAAADAVEKQHQIDGDTWGASLHGQAGIGCASCHAGHDEFPHKASDPWKPCAECHEDAVTAFATSVHAKAKNTPGAPKINCAMCHGNLHEVKSSSDESSPTHPKKMPATCGACHANPDLAVRGGIKLVQPLAAYQASVHARAVAKGEHAATCTDCHGSHGILPGADPASQVNHQRVPETCGTCHAEIATQYQASVHGVASAAGKRESPVCTDCHGEHKIIEPARPDSPVYASNVPKLTCGRCHGDLRLSEKFGLDGENVAAYEDSFHGLASRSGSQTVANCASCHGVHDILPSSDKRSHVHKENLAKTCGSCHPGAGDKYALGPVHTLPQDKAGAHPVVYWVRVAYIWLIWMTIVGMLLHNFLDLRRKALWPIPRPVVQVRDRPVRLMLPFRIAHGVLALSFITLVITGFALKYPESWWAAPLLGLEEKVALRGWLHRGAAVAMLLAFAFHFAHVIVDRKARAIIMGMLPSLHDVHEVKEKFRWYFGKRADMPKSPPLSYVEKMEYLALVWGTIVMALTGFMLWFNNWTLSNFPKWVSDLSTVIHFYEAILATLAILVWHFYFVFLDPLVYPLDTAFLTGREVPGRSLEREYPQEENDEESCEPEDAEA